MFCVSRQFVGCCWRSISSASSGWTDVIFFFFFFKGVSLVGSKKDTYCKRFPCKHHEAPSSHFLLSCDLYCFPSYIHVQKCRPQNALNVLIQKTHLAAGPVLETSWNAYCGAIYVEIVIQWMDVISKLVDGKSRWSVHLPFIHAPIIEFSGSLYTL